MTLSTKVPKYLNKPEKRHLPSNLIWQMAMWEEGFINRFAYDDRENGPEYPYSQLLMRVLNEGDYVNGRNGGTVSLFGASLEFDLTKGFPLLSGKFTPLKTIIKEMQWFLSGNANVKDLQAQGVNIWNEWAKEDGSIGPAYGYQWRNFNGQGIDQWDAIVRNVANLEPSARRRLIMTAWNPAQLDQMALPPCHMMAQFSYSFMGHEEDGTEIYGLDCQMYQRSVDSFLGLPFNIAGYAWLTHHLARTANELVDGYKLGNYRFVARKFSHVMGDVHIYASHFEAVTEYLSAACWRLKNGEPDFTGQITVTLDGIIDHTTGPKIKAPVSV